MKNRKIEFTVVVFVVVVFLGLLWYPMLSSDIKPWEQGRDIPTAEPSEDRRIHHVAGFSIIAPPAWESNNQPGDPLLRLRPKKSIPKRSAIIAVWKLEEAPPNVADMSQTQFQGQPARLKTETKAGTLDDTPSFLYSLYFERSGEWYSLQFGAPINGATPPEMIMRYLETFRVEEDK